ncbi:MAG TPA: DNA polymerase IV [Paenalcaligenes sp.]|nr:DNA polymerase IV [Paenalcaligenes sp.]
MTLDRPLDRRILHLDMDAFFASVELLRYPMLKGQPVVVGGRRVDAPRKRSDGGYEFARLGAYGGRGVVTTATYEARALGVHSAMSLMKAAQKAPQAILLPANFAAYQHYSRLFKQTVAEIAPHIENRGVDEIYIDVTQLEAPSLALAELLQQRIYERTGLSCSIGIAPNKLLAKIVSDFKKPGGITQIKSDEVPRRIWPLAVAVINGIGPKAQQKLHQLGIETVGQLAQASPALLQTHFGTNYARWLIEVAHGRDQSPVETVRIAQSHSRETTFSRDLHVRHDRHELSQILVDLCQRLQADLEQAQMFAQSIEIKLRFDDFKTLTRSTRTVRPIQEATHILYYARQNLRRVHLQDRRLRLLGVKAAHLLDVGEYRQNPMYAQQLSLL